jgi:hypothetical protein
MKICPVAAQFHAERCDKANSHFLQILQTRLRTDLSLLATYSILELRILHPALADVTIFPGP